MILKERFSTASGNSRHWELKIIVTLSLEFKKAVIRIVKLDPFSYGQKHYFRVYGLCNMVVHTCI